MSNSQDIERLETSEHVIMCVDILGYQEMLANEKNKGENKEENKHDLLNKINRLFEGAIETSKIFDYDKVDESVAANMRYHIYSDNVIFAIKLNGQNTIYALISMLRQASFLQQRSIRGGMTLRGGITIGKFYYNEISEKNFVYGQGLVDAYTLESKVAVDPKIVVDENVFKMLNEELEKKKDTYKNIDLVNCINNLCIREENGIIFVNYLTGIDSSSLNVSCIKSEDDLRSEIGEENFERFILTFINHKLFIEKNLKKYRYNDKNSDTKKYNDRVFRKYQWMRDYHNRCCKKLCLNEDLLIEVEYEDLFNNK